VDGKVKLADEGPHDFDCVAVEKSGEYLFYDAKAKARRNIKADTGIDEHYFVQYWNIYQSEKRESKFADFLLVFVDEHPQSESIYGIGFRELEHLGLENLFARKLVTMETDKRGTVTVYFALSLMQELRKLTAEEVSELRRLSAPTRGYTYAAR
jgi:hypothetical protein